ncbi:hypothetical protein C0991_011366 [Blastosporella zonata]|nr:hypothetical protein C0991_011366 [Blastosporella zonata]
MSIRPKWLRDVCSILFSGYYILYANEADEKLRRFRAVPTVEMLRTTWEKTTNPYLRMLTHLPWLSMRRKILLPRPKSSNYTRPITAYLFFHPHESQLRRATDLILDFPGGGFVAMSPEHHEERLRTWAVNTGKPVLSIDYGKAPEYPYPFAIDEAFDTYKILVESAGRVIGMSGEKLNIIITGDSASVHSEEFSNRSAYFSLLLSGATLAVNIVFKILESRPHPHDEPKLQQPVAIVLNYPALDFNFSSWMSPAHLRVLQSEQSSGNLPGLNDLAAQKDHLQHISPLSMVKDNKFSSHRTKHIKRNRSWKDAIRGLTSSSDKGTKHHKHTPSVLTSSRPKVSFKTEPDQTDGEGDLADAESEEEEDDVHFEKEENRPIRDRVRYKYPQLPSPPTSISDTELERQQEELSAAVEAANTQAVKAIGRKDRAEPIGTRLTMTSRTGYFQDRIVSPSMMRAMAILYIGPHRNPDFATDYRISPILAPPHILAQFPPLLLQCGEKDPFVDDSVIFAGRVREAKRARKHELQLAISGKSARFGVDGHRGSGISVSSLDPKMLAMMKKERDKLTKETEDDWVQLVLFSEWSHGYLQMPTLMMEAKAVIEELAEWIDEAFARNAEKSDNSHGKGLTYLDTSGPRTSSETETDDVGITFIPKKYQNETSPIKEPRENAKTFTVNGLAASHRDESSDESETNHSDRTASPTRGDHDHLIAKEIHTPVSRSTPHPPDTPRSGLRGPAGTQISETELMRRRRLLDSHIFEQ